MHLEHILYIFSRFALHILVELTYIMLRHSHRGNLRIGVDNRRNGVVGNTLERNLLEHTPYSHFGLATCDMGEHNLARNIACRIDIREVGLHKIVHYDTATMQLKVVECFQTLQISPTTDRNQYTLCLVLTIGSKHTIALQFKHLGIGKYLNT